MVRSGALFASVTTTVKFLVSLDGGAPLSVTRTVIRLVLGPWASVGVQVSTPLLGFRFTPAGAATKLKVKVLAGRSASLAVFVTVSVLSSVMVWSVGTDSTGALFASVTTTVKLLVSLDWGAPLSVTRTVIRLVLWPWASVGVQVSTPLLEFRFTPAGAATKLKVNVLAGRSVSLAVFVTVSVLSSVMVWSVGTVSTGALFASVTTTVKLLVSLDWGAPLSVTRTVIRLVLWPWASVGVQVSTPLLEFRFTPAGAATKLKVNVLAGRSVSLAVFVTVSVLSSVMVWSVGTVSTGALFASVTTTVKLLVSLDWGAPLSVTRTVIRLVLWPWASVGVQVSTPLLEFRFTPAGAATKLKV